jgi:hypothetical protein
MGGPAATIWAIAVFLIFAAVFGSSPAAGYEQRPNTISFGLQIGGGVWSGSGAYVVEAERGETQYPYDSFSTGGSFALRFRYSLDRSHAVGLSLEDERFNRKAELGPEAPEQLQVTNYVLDYYLYFYRRAKFCPYAALGIGYARRTFRMGESETVNPPGGPVANFGLGAEYFVRRPFSIDAVIRGYYHSGGGGSGVAGEAQLGFQYYLLH